MENESEHEKSFHLIDWEITGACTVQSTKTPRPTVIVRRGVDHWSATRFRNLLGSAGLQHLAACLGTLATFLGAGRHCFVVRDLFAGRGALIATLGAALAG